MRYPGSNLREDGNRHTLFALFHTGGGKVIEKLVGGYMEIVREFLEGDATRDGSSFPSGR
jgi:hypothetical protein